MRLDFVFTMIAKVLGIEVKALLTVFPQDFSSLKKLKKACDINFVYGILLHLGKNIPKR